MKNNFPEKDPEFIEKIRKLKDEIAAAAGNFGFSASDLNEMEDAFSELENAYQNHQQIKISAKTARQRKDSA